jgi:hypothetical protein
MVNGSGGCMIHKLKLLAEKTNKLWFGEGKKVSDFGMLVYPNPGNDRITIQFDSETIEEYELTLFNITGTVVLNDNGMTYEGGNQINMPASELAEGVYIIRLRKGSSVSSVRLVVNH